jgi:hypothetical protein
VSVATVRRALAEALAAAGEHSLEARGEIKGRGFVARRLRARRGEPWSFTIETPHPIGREPEAGLFAEWAGPPPDGTARFAELSATIEELGRQLRLAQRRADRERDARLRLEGEVADSAGGGTFSGLLGKRNRTTRPG